MLAFALILHLLIFQSPFGTLTYTILGDDEAEMFFNIRSTDGLITLLQSVANQAADQYIVSKRHDSVTTAYKSTLEYICLYIQIDAQLYLHYQGNEDQFYRLFYVLLILLMFVYSCW